jgi:hypothetical protein
MEEIDVVYIILVFWEQEVNGPLHEQNLYGAIWEPGCKCFFDIWRIVPIELQQFFVL